MKDREEIVFKELKEMRDFFEEQKREDIWVRVRTEEINTIPLDDMPLFVEQIMKDNNVYGSADAVSECMNDLMLMVTFPWDDVIRAVPLRYTALKTLCDRAGISGTSIMSYDKRPYHTPISPLERATVLSMFLRHFTSKAFILVRENKVSAILSGDEKDYTIMPVADLLQILLEELLVKYQKSQFVEGIASHEMAKAIFRINDDELEDRIKDSLGATETTIDVSGLTVRLELVSSDIGKYSATLIPAIQMQSVTMRIGEPLKLRHKGSDVKEFHKLCDKIFSLFEDGMKLMEEMGKIKVSNPQKTLENMAEKADLPLRSLKRAQENMLQECGSTCTGFEIYYFLYWIVEDHIQYMKEKGKPLSLQQKFDMQEKAARQLRVFGVEA